MFRPDAARKSIKIRRPKRQFPAMVCIEDCPSRNAPGRARLWAMDPQIAFPNPIARTDLPTPRRKWRYVVGGLGVVLFLSIVFLPQIMSSKIGRNLIKAYLENKYRATAWVGEMHTGWFSGTSIDGFSLIDPEGRAIKFARLDCGMTLGKLLTSNFDLRNATIKDLSVEFVVDFGDGTDSLDRMPDSWVPNAVAPTPAASKPRVPM